MKKRLAVFLATALAVTSLYVPAFAAETDIVDDGVYEEVAIDKQYSEVIEETEIINEEVVTEEIAEEMSIEADRTVADTETVEEKIAGTDSSILEISVSGNVVLTFDKIKNEAYYADSAYATPKRIAEAKFDKAADDTADYSISVNSADVFRRGSKYAAPGFIVGVEEGKYLTLKLVNDGNDNYYAPGTYVIPVTVEGNPACAEYEFTILPDITTTVVYVNKNERAHTIYTDGKKSLALSLEAKTWKEGAIKPDKVSKPVFSISSNVLGSSITLDEVKNKLVVPEGFSGTETVTVSTSVTNKKGETVPGSLEVVITSNAEEASVIKFGEKEWNRVERKYDFTPIFNTDAESKLTVSANKINGLYLAATDGANDVAVKYKASGKSIKLVTDYKGIKAVATGAAGVTTITATANVGGKKKDFAINVTAYDNSNDNLYLGLFTPELLLENQTFSASAINIFVANTASVSNAVTPEIGNYKLSVKGGKITMSSDNSFVVMPTDAVTEITYKPNGGTQKVYKVNNTLFTQTENIKKATVNVYSSFAAGESFSTTLKGDFGRVERLELQPDISTDAKLKNKKPYATYAGVYTVFNYSVVNGELTLSSTSQASDYVAGSYTYYAYPQTSTHQPAGNPFLLTIKVNKKVPAPKLTLSSNNLTVAKTAGATAKIGLKKYSNVRAINTIKVKNAYNKKVLNNFTSYFGLSDISVDLDASGAIIMNANLVVKDPKPENTDLNGIMVVNVTLVNGKTADVEIPVKVKFAK